MDEADLDDVVDSCYCYCSYCCCCCRLVVVFLLLILLPTLLLEAAPLVRRDAEVDAVQRYEDVILTLILSSPPLSLSVCVSLSLSLSLSRSRLVTPPPRP